MLTIGWKDIGHFEHFLRKIWEFCFSISGCQHMYSMNLNRFYSMKRFQKICSSVIFQQKSDFLLIIRQIGYLFFWLNGKILFSFDVLDNFTQISEWTTLFCRKRSFSTHSNIHKGWVAIQCVPILSSGLGFYAKKYMFSEIFL